MATETESGVMAATHYSSNALRFVERAVPAGEGVSRNVRILQQLFLPYDWTHHEEEWRDVPLSDA